MKITTSNTGSYSTETLSLSLTLFQLMCRALKNLKRNPEILAATKQLSASPCHLPECLATSKAKFPSSEGSRTLPQKLPWQHGNVFPNRIVGLGLIRSDPVGGSISIQSINLIRFNPFESGFVMQMHGLMILWGLSHFPRGAYLRKVIFLIKVNHHFA